MDILFTALSVACLVGVFFGVTRAQREADKCKDHAEDAERVHLSALEDRSRITGLERDVDALRRELRKLAGKFYAREAAREENDAMAAHFERPLGAVVIEAPACENWTAAQNEGPRSKAAACECAYCLRARQARAAEKAAILASRQALKPVNGGE